MKTLTTLSSIVLLASTLGFAGTAMAGADRVTPTRGGATALNPTGSATGAGTVGITTAPSVVAVGGTATITATATAGATITTVTPTAGTQGTFTCAGAVCTYTENKAGALNNDSVAVTIAYTVNGTPVVLKKIIPITIAPPAAS